MGFNPVDLALGNISAVNASNDKLRKENAKLRELVRHMGACIQHLDRTDEVGGCVCCPYQAVEHDCEFEQQMLELGIETS